MTVLYAPTDRFQQIQRAAADQRVRETGERIDDLIDMIYRSARQQGFQSAELFRSDTNGLWYLRYVGNDSYEIFGTWYAFKALPATEAIRRAKAWYDSNPAKLTVYASRDSFDEAYGLAASLASESIAAAVA